MYLSYDADIIVLQEVTPRYVSILMQNPYIRDIYSISHTIDTFRCDYGVFILYKKGLTLTSLTLYNLPTQMGRNCLVSEYLVNNIPLCCAVTHLESLDNARVRENQLKCIADYFKGVPNTIVMGDFNFDSEINFFQLGLISELEGEARTRKRNEIYQANLENNRKKGGVILENESIAKYFSDYHDVWLQFHDEKGYTFDSESNFMLQGYEQMRYDRILLKSQTNSWKPLSIELIGNEPIKEISKDDEPIFPSDHFGLMMKIALV